MVDDDDDDDASNDNDGPDVDSGADKDRPALDAVVNDDEKLADEEAEEEQDAAAAAAAALALALLAMVADMEAVDNDEAEPEDQLARDGLDDDEDEVDNVGRRRPRGECTGDPLLTLLLPLPGERAGEAGLSIHGYSSGDERESSIGVSHRQ